MHSDARCGEELTDLGGMLNDMQRHAADKHPEQHAAVSMGASPSFLDKLILMG